MILEEWLNIHNSRALIPGNGASVDYHSPLIFDMILIQDELLQVTEEVKIPFWKSDKDYTMTVSVLANELEIGQDRFNISKSEVERFIKDLLELQVDGKRARAKYQVTWTTASPIAKSYLWTLLNYKVNYDSPRLAKILNYNLDLAKYGFRGELYKTHH